MKNLKTLFSLLIILMAALVVLIVVGEGLVAYFHFSAREVEKESSPTGQEESILPPEGTSFEAALVQLDTSQKLVDYLNQNFVIEDRENSKAYFPEEFFEKKKGGAQDFAAFSAYTLYQHDFISFIIRYHYASEDSTESGDNYITQFRDTDLPKYIYFDEKGTHLIHHGWSFEAMCEKEEERLGRKITKYGTLFPLATDLVPGEWIERIENKN